ncbi:hypothetical protein K491DRAFT_260663 [Lophiostoma macrostomum CBS 122681]|uniref:Uncharacterized protein n=1 Tax=Lophiostoma macrostomum CBS 122681 TaxID=1314788 RepID=A0A6A6TGX6_9PLEO|nr:hypothetical protein K491DRAFT_260663 [Lophiostoma macrostomum CBS 122681]
MLRFGAYQIVQELYLVTSRSLRLRSESLRLNIRTSSPKNRFYQPLSRRCYHQDILAPIRPWVGRERVSNHVMFRGGIHWNFLNGFEVYFTACTSACTFAYVATACVN